MRMSFEELDLDGKEKDSGKFKASDLGTPIRAANCNHRRLSDADCSPRKHAMGTGYGAIFRVLRSLWWANQNFVGKPKRFKLGLVERPIGRARWQLVRRVQGIEG